MQGIIFEPQNLPDLPQPSFINHWVYESPLALSFACLAAALIVFGALRQTKYARRIGIPAIVLGLIAGASIFIIGNITITDTEHLKVRSRQLINAAASGDRSTLESLLGENVRVQTAFASQTGKDRVITLAISRAAPLIESVAIREIRVGLFGKQIARTQVKIKVSADLIPPMSWWTLEWTRPSPESNDWVVTHIEPIWIQGITNPAGSN